MDANIICVNFWNLVDVQLSVFAILSACNNTVTVIIFVRNAMNQIVTHLDRKINANGIGIWIAFNTGKRRRNELKNSDKTLWIQEYLEKITVLNKTIRAYRH